MICVNRKNEKNIFHEMLHNKRDECILMITSEGGNGKSTLLRFFRRQCFKQKILFALFEFGPGRQLSPIDFMRELTAQIGEQYFPNFSKMDHEFHKLSPSVIVGGGNVEGTIGLDINGQFLTSELKNTAGHDIINMGDITVNSPYTIPPDFFEWRLHKLTRTFCSDLKSVSMSYNLAIFVDACEHISLDTADWIIQYLLKPQQDIYIKEKSEKILYVLAGRPEHPIKLIPHEGWIESTIFLTNLSSFEQNDIEQYFKEEWNLKIEATYIQAYQLAIQYRAKMMAEIASMLAQCY